MEFRQTDAVAAKCQEKSRAGQYYYNFCPQKTIIFLHMFGVYVVTKCQKSKERRRIYDVVLKTYKL